jgi:hypothetical protein
VPLVIGLGATAEIATLIVTAAKRYSATAA